ncbi:MAG: hypothetical protein BGO31_00210 [Bacteroidetes bacterium 43-16]|uniref:major capsid protein n=1 Tax=uncultured Dysgonomonas sp. TaxID=206096 RepID=UPI00092A69F5|nr:major capsid protein [uncultured Dysgonomonas sp.]OJV51662.1 MAG: hypothetical protein BGO31_00210 [Bacteroidetes bacterium 43-16]
MATLPVEQARAIFTQTVVAIYQERIAVNSFLRSFFPTVESLGLAIQFEVQRGTELMAVDVIRGHQGNYNAVSRSTQKSFIPPYYREYIAATELELYNVTIGSANEGGVVSSQLFAQLVDQIASEVRLLVAMIERRYEYQCAEVFQTGIVTLKNGDNIDYKRKSGSKVNFSGTAPWDNDANDPFAHFETGCTFIREEGKSQAGVFTAILGRKALTALQNNEKYLKKGDNRNVFLTDMHEPQRNSTGASLHGQISAGSNKINLWSYPEIYEEKNGVKRPYIDDTNVIIVPEVTNFKMAFGAVPQVIDGKETPTVKKGAFVFGDYIDRRKATHEFDVMSAGVAVPVAVDQIFTMKVLV